MNNSDATTENNLLDNIEIGMANLYVLDNLSTYATVDGFNLPISNILYDKYRSLLLENSVRINLKGAWMDKVIYRPKYLSYVLYDTIELWHLILYLNDMVSAIEFNKTSLLVLDPASVELIMDIINIEKETLAEEPITL